MNLIEIWNTIRSGDEATLVDEHGTEIVHIIKRGSFIGILRQLYDKASEENILSDRWRWRVK